MAQRSACAGSENAISGAFSRPISEQTPLQDYIVNAVGEEKGLQPEASLATIQASLRASSEKTALGMLTILLSQHLKQAPQRISMEEWRAFRWVAERHPDWTRRIMQAAMDITVHNKSEPNAFQQITSVAAFLTETVKLCLSIWQAAKALPEVKVMQWEPPDDGRFTETDAANFMKAICRAAGKMSPEGPLSIGIWMRFRARGIIDQEEARLDNMDMLQEIWATIEKDLLEHEGGVQLEDQRNIEVNAATDAFSSGASISPEVIEDPTLMGELQPSQTLKEAFNNSSRPDNPVKKRKAKGLDIPFLFSSNCDLCGVWVEQAQLMEIYRIFCLGDGHAAVELVEVVEGVHKFRDPKWDSIKTQAYHIKDGKLWGARERPVLGCFGKPWNVSGESMYEPFRSDTIEAERLIAPHVEAIGIRGGGWKTLETGHLPSDNPQVETGIRTSDLSFALAGMAVWFSSNISKAAIILGFDNLNPWSERYMKLGTISMANAQHARRPPCKRFSWRNTSEKAIVVASVNSVLWKSTVMWA